MRIFQNLTRRRIPRGARQLHMFTDGRPEVVVANNSGIFSTLFSMRNHGKHVHPHVTLCIPEFWMDTAHPDYHTLDWGQTPFGLPKNAREEFLSIYPEHDMDKVITWGQYIELRRYAIDTLIKSGVEVFRGVPDIEKKPHGTFSVSIEGCIREFPENTYFYRSARAPRVNHNLGDNLPKVSHTKLYSLPQSDVPDSLIILGGKRSAIWAAQHFPGRLIGLITKTPELPLFVDEAMPPNIEIFSFDKFSDRSYLLEPSTTHPEECVITHTDEGGQTQPIFMGAMYCAIGLQQIKLPIEDQLPSNQVTRYPEENYSWVAQETLPMGSLIEATLRWAHMTGNISWAYETACFHKESGIKPIVRLFRESGIELPYVFFDRLMEKIPLLPRHTEEQIIFAYVSSYEETSGATVTDSKKDKLVQVLREFNTANQEKPSFSV